MQQKKTLIEKARTSLIQLPIYFMIFDFDEIFESRNKRIIISQFNVIIDFEYRLLFLAVHTGLIISEVFWIKFFIKIVH